MANNDVPDWEKLVELELPELKRKFTPEEIHMLDLHQQKLMETGLPELHETSFIPSSSELTPEQRGRFLLTCVNRALYEDSVEDFIMSDSIIQTILTVRKEHPDDQSATNAFRSRRTVVAYRYEDADIEPDKNPKFGVVSSRSYDSANSTKAA